jgi:hypothetical protein
MMKVFLSRPQFVTVNFRGPKSEQTKLSVEKAHMNRANVENMNRQGILLHM